jgi:hypothetical protein
MPAPAYYIYSHATGFDLRSIEELLAMLTEQIEFQSCVLLCELHICMKYWRTPKYRCKSNSSGSKQMVSTKKLEFLSKNSTLGGPPNELAFSMTM